MSVQYDIKKQTDEMCEKIAAERELSEKIAEQRGNAYHKEALDTLSKSINSIFEKITALEKQKDSEDRFKESLDNLDGKINILSKSYNRIDTNTSLGGQLDAKYKKFMHDCTSKNVHNPRAFLNDGNNQKMVEDVFKSYIRGKYTHLSDFETLSITKTMIESANAAGGFLVLPQISDQIIQRIYETSTVEQLASVENTFSNSFEVRTEDSLGKNAAKFTCELEEISNTPTPRFYNTLIYLHSCITQPSASVRQISDANWNIETLLMKSGANSLSLKLEDSYVNGNGMGMPVGFTTLPDWNVDPSTNEKVYTYGALEQIPSITAGIISGDDLINLQGSIISKVYTNDAVFGLHRKTFTYIRTLKDGQGRYIFDSTNLQGAPKFTLLGDMVVWFNDMIPFTASTTVTEKILPIVYGSFSQGYTIIRDSNPLTVLVNPFQSTDTITYRMTMRRGGSVTDFQALKLLSVSPVAPALVSNKIKIQK